MKGLVKYAQGPGNIQIQDVPEPAPACDQVKIKVMAASICGSDPNYYWKSTDHLNRLKCPVILGHEGSGVVVETGSSVRHVKPGDRVVAETTLSTCRSCDACRNRRYNDCTQRKGLGSSADGFFAEFVIAAGESVHKIPDSLSFEAAALLEPIACITHGIFEQGDIRPYHEVLVSGPGTMGLFAAQIAKLCGATVIQSGTARSLPRLKLAKSFGIDHIVNVSEEDLVTRVMEITEGRGVDVVVECSGMDSAIEACMRTIKSNGQYLWMASDSGDSHPDLLLSNLFIGRQLHVVGSRSSNPSAWDKALRLVFQGKLHMQELVTCSLPLEEWERGFEMVLNREAIKVILNPTMGS